MFFERVLRDVIQFSNDAAHLSFMWPTNKTPTRVFELSNEVRGGIACARVRVAKYRANLVERDYAMATRTERHRGEGPGRTRTRLDVVQGLSRTRSKDSPPGRGSRTRHLDVVR